MTRPSPRQVIEMVQEDASRATALLELIPSLKGERIQKFSISETGVITIKLIPPGFEERLKICQGYWS